jgi:putative transcriptional regulator
MRLRVNADGSTVQVLPDGRTTPYAPADANWLQGSTADLVRAARERLGLSQAGFALRLRLPVGTLRDWEQGRREPDAAAITLMRLVAGAPQALQRLTTRFASPVEAARYLARFADAAGAAQLKNEIALVLRHSPFDAQALADAAGDASPKLKLALAADRDGVRGG